MKNYKIFFLLLIFILLQSNTLSTIRYVKAGNPTPVAPYTSWATASDSLWKALRISVSGDTVFVGNGSYLLDFDTLQQGVALIGSGIDSCIFNLHHLSNLNNFSFVVSDSSLISNIQFRGYNYNDGFGIFGTNCNNTIITNNLFTKCNNAVACVGIKIISNQFILNQTAINEPLSTLSPVQISENTFVNCTNSIGLRGSKAIIRNNYFYVDYSSDRPTFINDFGGGRPEITNNIFFYARVNKPIDQLIAAHNGDLIQNNVLISRTDYQEPFILTADPIISKNNHFEGRLNAHHLYFQAIGPQLVIKNNNYWNTGLLYYPSYNNPFRDTELQQDPMFIDSTDFHLQKYSPLIDRGDSSVLDKDGSISDIGVYGGPLGESYVYIDKAPRAPVGLAVTLNADTVLLKWRKNTESDIRKYQIYTDSTTNVTTDTNRYLTSVNDTLLKIPKSYFSGSSAYFRIVAVDSGYNKSQGGIAVGVVLTGIDEGGELAGERYRLYQNYPNPYGGAGKEKTKISYELKKRGYVKLRVYNVVGEELAVLVNGEQEAGYYEEEFGAPEVRKGLEKHILTSGIYIYKLEIRDSETGHPVFNESRKMLFVK